MPSNNNQGSRAFTAIAALAAVGSVIYAITAPTSQRIGVVEQQIADVRSAMRDDDMRERDDIDQFGILAERFKEVETQFAAAAQLEAAYRKQLERRMLQMEDLQDDVRQRLVRVEVEVEGAEP